MRRTSGPGRRPAKSGFQYVVGGADPHHVFGVPKEALTLGAERRAQHRRRSMKAAEAKEQVWSALERTRDEIVERCCQLIRIPSENPPGDTSAMAGHLLELFRSRGIATEVYEPKPNNPNVVAHLRPFQPG